MTPTQSAVRAACDAQPDERADVHCIYPHCKCVKLGFEDVLDTLLANARAEGAAGEREACAEVAEEQMDDGYGNGPYYVWADGPEIAAAIRARAAKEASSG